MNIAISIHLLQNFYSILLGSYLFLVIAITLYVQYKNPRLDRGMFFILGFCLLAFTLGRPLSISRDDAAYVSMSSSICAIIECGLTFQHSRDWLWFFSVSLLKSITDIEGALAILATISVAIKLYIIDRLCKQKMTALMLLIPLIYIQYDFTQFRAGFALSWYFLGILFLIKNRTYIASGFMVSNFLFHLQSLPSIALLPTTWLNKKKWILPTITVILTCSIYAGLFPQWLHLEGFGIISTNIQPYLSMQNKGLYSDTRIFPIGYIPILGYGLWLCWGIAPQMDRLIKVAGASIGLAVLLAWIFSLNATIQTRLFEFYIAPVVFLAGNIGLNKTKLIGTIALTITLYLRLELLHDWVIG